MIVIIYQMTQINILEDIYPKKHDIAMASNSNMFIVNSIKSNQLVCKFKRETQTWHGDRISLL